MGNLPTHQPIKRRDATQMTNQKQRAGAGSRARKSDPGIPKEESARRARALAHPSRALGAASLAVKPRRERGAQGAESLSSVYPASEKRKG